jgi:hypothetical protein
MGKHVCEPTEVGGEYSEAAGGLEGKKHDFRHCYIERGVLHWYQQGHLCSAIQWVSFFTMLFQCGHCIDDLVM